jgi:hypothetical protein
MMLQNYKNVKEELGPMMKMSEWGLDWGGEEGIRKWTEFR